MPSTNEGLERLREWYLKHGGIINKATISRTNEAEGCGLIAKESIQAKEIVLSVPMSICLHIDAVEKSVIREIVDKEPHLSDMQDELLTLLLMAERRQGKESFWWPYLRVMPTEYDTPLYWSEEEKKHLMGTNVYLLTTMMEKRIEKDWMELHEDLVAKYPTILSGLTTEDYRWALSTIWSRAVGVERDGQYLRCLAPALDMCNHHPQAAQSLDELLRYEAEAEADAIVFRSGDTVEPGHQCYLVYGPYTNAKLLYRWIYGFVTSSPNPYHGVDFWVRVPPSAKDAEWKMDQLRQHALTREQTYDFQGTLRGNGVTVPLMATVRMIHLAENEYDQIDKVFKGEKVSDKNEKASFTSLAMFLERKLGACATSIEEDAIALDKLERLLVDDVGSDDQAEEDDDAKRKIGLRQTMRRRACALQILLEDKLVVRDTLACIQSQLEKI